MREGTAQDQSYMVSIHEPKESPGKLIFTFVPKNLQPESDAGNGPHRVRQFIVSVRHAEDGFAWDWNGSPDDPEDLREEIQAEITDRMEDRKRWIDRVTSLVDEVERWAIEMDWSPRRLEKRLDDVRIGKHIVPALLMQKDTCRVLLEPVGRSTPGTDGLVELYLMPAHDDIASLYYYEDRLTVHYAFAGSKVVARVRDAQRMPLSGETLEKVLSEMMQHAP